MTIDPVTTVEQNGATRRPRRLGVEAAIAIAVLVASGVWATQFWNTWTSQGGQPEFYQIYFEPAVMIACGKGFVISEQQPKVLEDFLWRRRDSLACNELPPELKLGDRGLYQEAWTYLQYTVGWSWRILGISWSGLGPLFGLLFGTVTVLAYGIFRIGMGPLLAVMCATGFATSSLQLLNLPHLRDYSKAPFTLALVLILGWMVTRPPRRSTVLLLAATYGAVLGFGYGFRTDLLINLPVMAIVLFGFLDGGISKNLVLKTMATALFVATFVVVSWPITSAVYKKGGCQWHVALLGLQSPFDDRLRLSPAPYEFGYAYADGYVIRGVQGFAHRLDPAAEIPQYCGHEYDVQSGRLISTIVSTFPGDFVTRAYASTLQIVELPFVHLMPAAQEWASGVFSLRSALLQPRHPWGALLAAASVLLATVASLRLGLFLLFFLGYFGGYPAVQFQERHFFHLEFIGWWAIGFVAQQGIGGVRGLISRQREAGPTVRRLAMCAVTIAVLSTVVFGGLVVVARWYQGRQARQLFAGYLAAPKTPVADPSAALVGIPAEDWPQFIEVGLDESACGPRPSVTFTYDRSNPDNDFTRTVTIERRSTAVGTTRVLLPVFERFAGIAVSDPAPGCLVGVSRFTDLPSQRLLLGVVLPPDWDSLPMHQRLPRWEGGSPLASSAPPVVSLLTAPLLPAAQVAP